MVPEEALSNCGLSVDWSGLICRGQDHDLLQCPGAKAASGAVCRWRRFPDAAEVSICDSTSWAAVPRFAETVGSWANLM